MAIAGRVLIMPKGVYDETVTYEMLDMVSCDGITWVAKKGSVGIRPSADTAEYWFAMVGVSAQDFNAFKTEVLETVNEALRESGVGADEKLEEMQAKVDATNEALKGYVKNTGGTMTGALKVVNPNVDGEGVRNITAGKTALVAGTSPLATGAIHVVYE